MLWTNKLPEDVGHGEDTLGYELRIVVIPIFARNVRRGRVDEDLPLLLEVGDDAQHDDQRVGEIS